MALLTSTKTRAQIAADSLLAGPAATFNFMLSRWKQQFDSIWRSPNPQEILTALDTNALELFTLSAQMVGFLETLQPGCTAASLALMLPVTFDGEGRATITPEE